MKSALAVPLSRNAAWHDGSTRPRLRGALGLLFLERLRSSEIPRHQHPKAVIGEPMVVQRRFGQSQCFTVVTSGPDNAGPGDRRQRFPDDR